MNVHALHFGRFLCWCLALLLFPAARGWAGNGVYVIGHMTNSTDAADWALEKKANALEADLRFDDWGTPTEFKHGWPCDCPDNKYVPTYADSVCPHLGDSPCNAATAAAELLQHVAGNQRLALFIVDSKVNARMTEKTLKAAGTKVITLLEQNLFEKGYAGRVVVGSSSLKTYAYLEAAATQASLLPPQYASRIYFTIDGEGHDLTGVLNQLVKLSPNRVYGTGISALAPGDYEDTISVAAYNQQEGVTGLTYIWTIDAGSSMLRYLRNGAQGVMTNFPETLYRITQEQGISLATPRDEIPAATNTTVYRQFPGDCDCDYQKGAGCSITTAAPANLACRCKDKSKSCAGKVVICLDQTSPFCTSPTKSIESCLQGQGNCAGYKNVPGAS